MKIYGENTKKYFVFDIDNTLISRGETASEKYYSQLLSPIFYNISEKGNLFTINTSRKLEHIEFIDNLLIDGVDYIITENGRHIHCNTVGNINNIELDSQWEEIVENARKIDERLIDHIKEEYGVTFAEINSISPYYLHIRKKIDDLEKILENYSLNEDYSVLRNESCSKVVSNIVSKKGALNHIINKNSLNYLYVGVGDNLLDEMFMEICDKRIQITKVNLIELGQLITKIISEN